MRVAPEIRDRNAGLDRQRARWGKRHRAHRAFFALLAALAVSLSLALTLCTTAAQATTLIKLSVDQMAKMADSVVLADTNATTARQVGGGGDSRGQIQTVVDLNVRKTIKGTVTPRKTIVAPGGCVGNLSMVVDLAPVFTPGETCLLFLDAQGRVLGGPQGKLTVRDGYVPSLARPISEIEEQIRKVLGRVLPGLGVAGGAGLSAGTGSQSAALTTREGSQTLSARPASPSNAVKSTTSATEQIPGSDTASAYFDDGFEVGTSNWTLQGSPTWASTTYRKSGGTRSVYCAGSTVSAPGPYRNNMNARMVTGPINLSSVTKGTLEFDLWMNSERGYDFLYYYFSTDGTHFYGAGWSGSTGGSWQHMSINLKSVPNGSGGTRDITGRSQVWLMFAFATDSSRTMEGAYLDEISIAGESSSTPAPAPVIASITPDSASAGTGSQVTISGTGFGSSAGQVNFFYRSGQPTIPAPVVSWADSQIVARVPTAIINGYPASAGSGPVTVTTSSGSTSNSFTFRVSFGYGGVKWQSPDVTFLVNSNTSDTSAESTLVQGAASTWNAASGLRLTYSGSSTISSSVYDQKQVVYWTNDLAAGVLAQAAYWYSGSNILDADIAFNDNYLWGDGSGSTYDIQSIALHEMGHWLNLRDLYGDLDATKVMYGYGETGQVRRQLSSDDAAGAIWLYGGPPATQYTISAGVSGSGGTILPATQIVAGGGSATVTLAPNSGYVFDRLTDNGVDVTSQVSALRYTINPVTANHTLVATFAVASQTPTRFEQTDSRIVYQGTWTTGSSSSYSGGSYRYTSSSGSSVTITFNGTSLDWIARKSSNQGIARVTLDGGAPVLVDLYNSSTLYKQRVWSTGTLSSGAHTVRIEWTGQKRSSASGTTINIDAVDVMGTLTQAPTPPTPTRFEQTDSRFVYQGTWSTASSSSLSGRSHRVASSAGASVTITFNGTSFDWIARKSSNQGIARVTLDGVAPVLVDLYNSSTLYKQRVWNTGTLNSGVHTVRIEWTGQKRSSASGTAISIDAVDVIGTLQ